MGPAGHHLPAWTTSSLEQRDDAVTSRLGWVPSPNQRGTLDIFWTCAATLFLCCWSVLCLNVPAKTDSRWTKFWNRILFSGLCCLGPEFVLQLAIGQLASARKTLQDFHRDYPSSKNGECRWTLTHSFYADMGGFHLLEPDMDNKRTVASARTIPLTGPQLLYLILHGYVAYPEVPEGEIKRLNKMDALLRIITGVQIIWFLVNTIARQSLGLATTTLELTTVAFIFCGLVTMVVWWYKPSGVETTQLVRSRRSVAEILQDAGVPQGRIYRLTPLDFIDRKQWSWSIYWSNWVNIMRHLGIHWGIEELPVVRFQNTIALEVAGWYYVLFGTISAIYLSIFLLAWNFDFPSPVEQRLWRGASVMALGSLPCLLLVNALNFEWKSTIDGWIARFRRPHSQHTRRWSLLEGRHGQVPTSSGCLARIVAGMRNNSLTQDPALEAPLTAIVPIYVLGICYCFPRLYIWIADIIELRSLHPSCYETVNWTNGIPHF